MCLLVPTRTLPIEKTCIHKHTVYLAAAYVSQYSWHSPAAAQVLANPPHWLKVACIFVFVGEQLADKTIEESLHVLVCERIGEVTVAFHVLLADV